MRPERRRRPDVVAAVVRPPSNAGTGRGSRRYRTAVPLGRSAHATSRSGLDRRRADRPLLRLRTPCHAEPSRHEPAAHDRREDLGRPRRRPGRRAPRRSSRSTSTSSTRSRRRRRSRGLRARGLRVRHPDRTVATADHSTPTHARTLPMADPMAAAQVDQLTRNCARVRHPAPRPRLAEPGDRPRHRPAAGPDPARHDDRLRRLAHRDPRRVRGARVRDRDERGRDGPRDPDAAPAPAEDLRGPRRRPPRARRQRQGHHPRPDRPDRDRRRDRPRLRVPRRRDPRADDGTADDDLQHEHRGRRAGRPDRPGRHDVRVRPRPAPCPAGRRLGRGRRALADAADRRRRDATTGRSRSTPPPSSRWSPTARTRAWASRSRRASRRPTTRPIRPPAGRSSGPSSTWTSGPASRSSARRSTSSSSARARTAGSATCGSRPTVLKDRKVADGVRVMIVPGLRRGEARGRAGGPPRGLPGGRRRVARGRLLDVHRDERRPAVARPVRDQHVEPQLRGPPGQGRPDVPRLAADRGRVGDRAASSPTRARCPGSRRSPRSAGAEPDGRAVPRRSRAAVIPLPAENVDTDQIVPARYLKVTDKAGLARGALPRLALRRGRRRSRSRGSCSTEPAMAGPADPARRRQLRRRVVARARARGR